MKFSPETLQILKNFATVNTNILIHPGSQLATIATGKNVFATAIVKEEFPVEIAIYDLGSLLGLLTINPDAEVEFGDKSLTITNGTAQFTYFYSDPSIIVSPPQKTITLDEHYKFSLAKEDITTLLKAAAIMSSPMLTVTAKNGVVSINVGDPKTRASNNYKQVV